MYIGSVFFENKNLRRLKCSILLLLSKKIIQKILHEISFGGGAINESLVHLSNPNLPFGGVGTSGIGNYHSKAGFDTFTHYKSILHKSFLFEPNVKYTPFTEFKMRILKFILE